MDEWRTTANGVPMNLVDMIKGGYFGESPFIDRRVLVTPADPSNYYPNRVCNPIALVLHEPQEPADQRESTPAYFQIPNVQASTRWYSDNDGDLYQLVPFPASAIANGLDGKPEPRFNDGGPEFNGRSLNTTTDNIEIEGYTESISQTFSQAQFAGVKDWIVLCMVLWDIPRNPARVLSHAQVSVQRTDGEWIRSKSGVVQEAVNTVLKLEKDVQDLKAALFGVAKANNERNDKQDGLLWGQQIQINALKDGK